MRQKLQISSLPMPVSCAEVQDPDLHPNPCQLLHKMHAAANKRQHQKGERFV